MANRPVDAVPLVSFGANHLALLRLLSDAGPCSRPPGEGLDSRQRRDRRRHTSWSQRERADDITSTGFRSRLDSRVLAPLPSRTRTKNGEPGGLTLEYPVVRTALAHGVVEEREQDGRSAKRIVAALPLAPAEICPRGLLVVAALAEMKRSVTDTAGDSVRAITGSAARMRRSPGGRSRVLYVRLTEEEDRQVRDRAAKAGLSGQRFLIETALSGSAETAAAHRHAAVEARATRVVLKGMASNLNQMTKWANANHVLPAHLDRPLDDVGRAVAAVEQAAGAFGMASGRNAQVNDAATPKVPS